MYAAIFDTPEGQNWLKQWRAVFITRKALLPTVSTEARNFHGDLLQRAQNQSISPCTMCTSSAVQSKVLNCPFHKCFRDELVNKHAYGFNGSQALSWKNTKAENWARSPWEIAKLFMPPIGYQNKTKIEKTDFNGIAGFIINCKRFHGTITVTVCKKARIAVNNIRHMPDMDDSVLTDQATIECIDIMYALLNEPGLQTRPEVVQARNELDKLKTADLSIDENAYKYICHELHDEFQQRLDDIEMKLQSKEFDTQTAKDSIRTEGFKVQKNLELLCERLSNDLLKTKNDILQSINEEIKRFMDRIDEHVEQSVRKGLTTLTKHVAKQQRQATKHFKELVADHEDQKEKHLQQLREKEVENLQKRKLDLQKQLLKHYQATGAVRIKVRLDIDAAVEDIYEKPKLKWKTKTDKDGQITEEEILKIDQIFLSDNDMMAKTIFVQGEPGTGKSSLCKKIVDDWCKLKEGGKGETKEDSRLSQFEFLFYIRLREVEDRCNIKDMILQCLIEQILSDYKESKELLAAILKSDCCLLLLDGLDEWKHGSCKRDERIPHAETGWTNCTTLITTRPYKLAELKLSRLKLGNHVKLQGVQSPRKLVARLIQEFEKDKVNKCPKTCVKDLKKNGLWHFRGIPIVLGHVVWLWFRNKLKANMSQCTVYMEILADLWCEMNDKTHIEDNDIPKEFLDSLSELAFSKLFSANKDDSIVFEIKEDQLKKEYQRKSLESGIMSCSNKIGERSASYQFLHKTLQEFLAALYLANCGSDLSKHCQHVQEVYRHNMKEGVLNLAQMFLFLCGLNINAAKVFSEILNELCTEYFERNGYSALEASTFQSMILKGYEEAEKNGHTGIDLNLEHFVLKDYFIDFNDDDDDDDDGDDNAHFEKHMSHCLDKNKSNIVSLLIQKRIDLPSVLQYNNDLRVLDLETCTSLKFLYLEAGPYKAINQLNLNGLLEFEIEFSYFEKAIKLVSLFLSSDIKCLKKLSLRNVDLQCKAEEIFCRLQHVEQLCVTGNSLPNDSPLSLGHLEHLNELFLGELAFSDVVIPQMRNLHRLTVKFRTQQRAPKLMTALTLCYNMDGSPLRLADFHLSNVVMSAGEFKGLFRMVIQERHYVHCRLDRCTIKSEEDIRQTEVETQNQPDLQMVAPLPASPDFTTPIRLLGLTVSAGMFKRLLSMVIQARHSVNCKLTHCTIEPEEDMKQMKLDTENQPAIQMVAPLTASPDYTTSILLCEMTVSAEMLRRLVSMVIHARHSVNCTLKHCTIESEKDVRRIEVETENQPALQMVAPLPASSDDITHITLYGMTDVSAEMFRYLVSIAIQARHSVKCTLDSCTIKSEEDVRRMEAEMENQLLLKDRKFSKDVYGLNVWFISFTVNI